VVVQFVVDHFANQHSCLCGGELLTEGNSVRSGQESEHDREISIPDSIVDSLAGSHGVSWDDRIKAFSEIV